MLNTKLREEKRINKIKKAEEKKYKNGKKEPKRVKRGKSKFSNKYRERIESIREADEKARRKTEREITKRNENYVHTKGDKQIRSSKMKNFENKGRRTKTKQTK